MEEIFWDSPHQVDMKNVFKSSKHFFVYFYTLETHCESIKPSFITIFVTYFKLIAEVHYVQFIVFVIFCQVAMRTQSARDLLFGFNIN